MCITAGQAVVNDTGKFAQTFRNLLPALPAAAADLLRHVFRCKEAGMIDIYSGRKIAAFLRQSADLSIIRFIAVFFPDALDHIHSCQILVETDFVHIPGFVCKVCKPALFRTDGFVQQGPHQGPGAGAEIDAVLLLRYGRDSRRRIMGCRRDHFRTAAGFPDNLILQFSDISTRRDDGQENALRKTEQADQFRVPLFFPFHEQLCGGGFRILAFHHACQKIVQVIRDHEHILSTRQDIRLKSLICHQLVDRVERCLHDSGSFVEFFRRKKLFQFPVHPLCSAVTVSVSLSQYLPIAVRQHIVYAPGVDSNAERLQSLFRTLFKPGQNLGKDMLIIPAQRSIDSDHAIFKSMNLVQSQMPVFHAAADQPAAGSAQVNSQIVVSHVFLPLTIISGHRAPIALSLSVSFVVFQCGIHLFFGEHIHFARAHAAPLHLSAPLHGQGKTVGTL